MGIAVPGTFPGQLAATQDDYKRWFQMIRDAGYNTIRIYTLHFPHFYEELARFNSENPNHPLLLFHGVWLEEEVSGYDNDLFSLTEIFDQEIRENVRAVHGDIEIGPRVGKAYGVYKTDISEWVIGYIIGREIHPPEVLHTNGLYPDKTSYEGIYLNMENARASEAWLLERMDVLLTFEMDRYNTQRPISASSWPTLDPLEHPFEESDYEVSASLDFQQVDFSRAEAGFFATYHAYPYYPNYISRDPKYTVFHDHLGQNSYLGYLTYLNAHYHRFPLIIGEFGGASSWGVAKYAHSGIHHGGYSERQQGENNVRMFKNLDQAGTGGGIQFAFMDEWFKQTWITNPLDENIERRIIWHNVTAAEQNYGIIGFTKESVEMHRWMSFPEESPVTYILSGADFAYLHLELGLHQHLLESDTVWIGLDTYDANLGESVLPNDHSVTNRAEFALRITSYKAELFVTEAYDLFGIWHGTSGPEQLYQSVVSNGGKWNLVRWKNDVRDHDVQDIGRLHVNRLNMPPGSTDAVRLYDDRIRIRLPWTLLQFTDPSQHRVIHDDRNIPGTGTRISDGIALSLFYRGFKAESTDRYRWPTWNHALNASEYKKAGYHVIQEALPGLPGNPIARADHYTVGVESETIIPEYLGVLQNDLSLDGTPMYSLLESPPKYGMVKLDGSGAFTYIAATGFKGEDSFRYRVRAGAHWSEPVTVTLSVEGTPTGRGFAQLYPNPVNAAITIESSSTIDTVTIYNVIGERILTKPVHSTKTSITLQTLSSGVYFAMVTSGNQYQLKKFSVVR